VPEGTARRFYDREDILDYNDKKKRRRPDYDDGNHEDRNEPIDG